VRAEHEAVREAGLVGREEAIERRKEALTERVPQPQQAGSIDSQVLRGVRPIQGHGCEYLLAGEVGAVVKIGESVRESTRADDAQSIPETDGNRRPAFPVPGDADPSGEVIGLKVEPDGLGTQVRVGDDPAGRFREVGRTRRHGVDRQSGRLRSHCAQQDHAEEESGEGAPVSQAQPEADDRDDTRHRPQARRAERHVGSDHDSCGERNRKADQ
jgi:hypothetical protein